MKRLSKAIASITLLGSMLAASQVANAAVTTQKQVDDHPGCILNMIHLAKAGHFSSAGELVFTQVSPFSSTPTRYVTCADHGAVVKNINVFGFSGNLYRITTPSCNVKVPKGDVLVVTADMNQYRPDPQPKCFIIHYSDINKLKTYSSNDLS
jgi:hypothetical protein